MKTVNIDGYEIATLSADELLAYVKDCYENRRPHLTTTLNLEMIARGSKNREYKDLVLKSDLIIADGMPLVWFSKIFRKNKIKERVTGTDLTDDILSNLDLGGIAVVGGIDPSKAILKYPMDVRNCYIYDGKVDANDHLLLSSICNEIRERNLYFVFIALGVPKQDLVAKYFRKELDRNFIISVGGAFELLGAITKRAPRSLQRLGLEWFWRLLIEPKRLWKRYLLNYPRAIYILLRSI